MIRLETRAPAKVNLSLRVLARRADGLHELASIVAFAAEGDSLTLEPGGGLELSVRGPRAAAAGPVPDNLVLKAARAAKERISRLQLGRFVLEKQLPAGAGLGGGSADAAAALRLIAQANGLAADDDRVLDAARVTGADVCVCLDPRAKLMHGAGEFVSAPLGLPALDAVLVFPGVATATGDVFRAHAPPVARHDGRYAESEIPRQRAALIEFLARQQNELELAARSIAPEIAEARALLERTGAPRLVRMTGSGSTMFAVYDDAEAARKAAINVREQKTDWWVLATTLA